MCAVPTCQQSGPPQPGTVVKPPPRVCCCACICTSTALAPACLCMKVHTDRIVCGSGLAVWTPTSLSASLVSKHVLSHVIDNTIESFYSTSSKSSTIICSNNPFNRLDLSICPYTQKKASEWRKICKCYMCKSPLYMLPVAIAFKGRYSQR